MTSRPRSPIDAVADDFVREFAALHPIAATHLGIAGHDHELPDWSPDGAAARAEAERRLLARVAALRPLDDVDRITQEAITERHTLSVELHESGESLRDLNVIASPPQELRDVFDLMSTGSVEDWETIARRLAAVPRALAGYMAALRVGRDRGLLPALRQVEAVASQAGTLANPGSSFFTAFVAGARPDGRLPEPTLAAALDAGARRAREAYAGLAAFLTDEIAPAAPAADGVGRERYERFSRHFLGATIDLDETYEWGRDELARIVAEQRAVAAELFGPGVTPEEAMTRLDADPRRRIHGTEALRDWMQETSDAAIAGLKDVHFDIPEPVQVLECRIAPTHTGGIYYTGPTADFSRPGRMWWAVPEGVTEFSTWQEKTTVHHEGVPGHHLQIAQTVYRAELLNTWRRLFCWVSGHGEGWALYAERLMDDLGFLADPGDRMGMLDAQRLRAARVVLDIGVHLGKPTPAELGGGTWDAATAWVFLSSNTTMAESFRRFELDRYLGWPGQAPSYTVGQRLWEQIRDDVRAAAAGRGEPFDLKAFHRHALDIGSVGLDTLRRALTMTAGR